MKHENHNNNKIILTIIRINAYKSKTQINIIPYLIISYYL